MAFACSATGAPQALTVDQLAVLRIQPLLKYRCLACHGDDGEKIKGGYDMRSPKGLFAGGDSGEAAIVDRKPGESPLFLSVTRAHEDWDPMPPKEADGLKANEIEWLRQWISGGAPWPEGEERAAIQKQSDRLLAGDGMRVKTSKALSEEWANRRYKPDDLWAYRPVRKPRAPEGSLGIDSLIGRRMPKGLAVAPQADGRTFIRRATFDLLGLPPTPGEVRAFEAAYRKDSQAAKAALVERLLASPHYGERMAQHWLDVTRYADTSGFANDYERGNAWRYRDYVIRAFNTDKPYDEFVREQIAGDEIDATDPEKLIATGFLRMGPWELTGMEVEKIARQRFLDDVTNATGETFLSHSLQCARCHDHKFDPVPTRDFYSMQAVFATTQLAERAAAFLPEENQAGFEEQKYLDEKRIDFEKTKKRLDQKKIEGARLWFKEKGIDPAPFEAALAKSNGNFRPARQLLQKQKVPEDEIPDKFVGFQKEEFGLKGVSNKGDERLGLELERYQPYAFAVYTGGTPTLTRVKTALRMPADPMRNGKIEQTCILTGGDPFSPSDPVNAAALSAVESFNPELRVEFPTGATGRRLALAKWISNPANPLTTRSIVNRIWLWHFAQPLAGNPNNFGGTGKKPTHPELLDWLAASLVEGGWSIKSLHGTIMLSEAYGRSARHPDPAALEEGDPLGKSYAAFRPRRLSAEEIRDATLAVSGELNYTLGGIPVRPEINREAALQPRYVMGGIAAAWIPNPKPAQRHRRTIYVHKVRGLRDPFMEVFNEPGPDFSCELRDASTVTPQVFSLFNSQTSANRALALAQRALRERKGQSRESVIQQILRLTLCREPAPAELASGLRHWERMIEVQRSVTPRRASYPVSIVREAIEENGGEKFTFTELMPAYRDFVPDLQAADVDVETRALAEFCLVILNSNEFVHVF